jgi:hypothetical protein
MDVPFSTPHTSIGLGQDRFLPGAVLFLVMASRVGPFVILGMIIRPDD